MKSIVQYLTLLCAVVVQSATAQTFFPDPRTFTVTQPCDATVSIRTQRDPVPLTVDQAYTALGENKPTGATHAFITFDSERRWVALECGQYADVPVTNGGEDGDCLPFFDDIDNPLAVGFGGVVDLTPPPPPLNAFDLAVNAVCGAPGKQVSRDEFKALLRNHAEVLTALRAFTGDRVFAGRPAPADEQAFLNDLADAWFNIHAFDHIFCGEPDPGGKIGGLHFHGRYLQLQQDDLACRLGNDHKAEVVPGVIYTMGVRMPIDGDSARSPVKGYGYTLSAEEILNVVTRAFRENPTTSSRSTACLLDLSDDGKTFVTVFVRRANGIRTFYPDATPAADDPACRNALTVP